MRPFRSGCTALVREPCALRAAILRGLAFHGGETMRLQSLNGSWPEDWAANLSIDSGPEDGAPMLLFSGLGVSAYPLRPIADACDGMPVRVRLRSLPGHNGDPRAFRD